MTELTPIYAFRRKGQPDFCTCNLARYSELRFKQHMYEVEIFYYPHQVEAALEQARKEGVAEGGAIPMKYRRMAFNAQLQDDVRELRAKLTEAEAQAVQYVTALWGIIDDIDSYGDMAKSNDSVFRKLTEKRQKDRWNTGITCDGYTLAIPNTEALTTLLAAERERCAAVIMSRRNNRFADNRTIWPMRVTATSAETTCPSRRRSSVATRKFLHHLRPSFTFLPRWNISS